MDITVDTVREAQFRQAWKGYDTAEVDDFLDEVAKGVEQLTRKVTELSGRIEGAEDRAARAEARPALRSEPDESVRRTLVLAQRAADLVVTEAKAVADRIVADSREQAAQALALAGADANRIREEAQQDAAHVVADAEAAAERQTAVRAAELQQNLNGLVEEQTRRQLELEQLHGAIEKARAQFRGLLTAQLEQLDSPAVTGQVDEAMARVTQSET